MTDPLRRPARLQFGPYVLDPESGELFKGRIRIRLPGQPSQILIHLLNHPGRVIAREELREQVWRAGTYVDFEHSLSAAVNRLRRALNDTAEKPRYIETLPGRGYRFIGTVEMLDRVESATRRPTLSDTGTAPPLPIAEDVSLPDKAGVAACHATRSTWRRLSPPIAALGLAAIAGVWFYNHHSRPATIIGSLVVADFSNGTGDTVFDDSLRQALTVELAQSPHLSVVSDERIRHTLKFMGRLTGAALGLSESREVCQRVGSDAVVAGAIAKFGARYTVALNASDCGSGNNIFREQLQAASKEDVLTTLSHLATDFRSRAGESPDVIKRHSAPLPEATTPSLEALKAYSTGMQIAARSGFAAGLPHLKRAIEIDPQFALAHAYLGRLYADMGEPDLAEKATRRAYELRDRTGERERFFIIFSYERQIAGNLQKTQQTLDLWAQTYPLDAAPHALLSGLTTLGTAQYSRCEKEAKKAIELNPDSAAARMNLATAYLAGNQMNRANVALKEAAASGLEIDDLLMLRYNLALLKNDTAAMAREVASTKGRTGAEDWMWHQQAFAMARAGCLRQARAYSQRAIELSQQNGFRGRAALFQSGRAIYEATLGDAVFARECAKEALRLSKDRDVQYAAAFALALVAAADRSQSISERLATEYPEDTPIRFSYLPSLHALVALAHGNSETALHQLTLPATDLAFARTAFVGYFGTLYPAFVRGLVYAAMHRNVEAATEFQKLNDHPGLVLNDPVGVRALFETGRVLALAREREKSQAAFERFLHLWRNADRDNPFLIRARAELSRLRQGPKPDTWSQN